MKKLFSALLVLFLLPVFLSPAAFAESGALSRCSDAEIRQLYESLREELIRRGLPLTPEITLPEGKYIVGEEIQPGSYTLRCTGTSGDTYGDLYSSLGDVYGSLDSSLGGLMGSLGGMMSNVINAEVKILGDYGTVLKSYELKTGDSVRVTLSADTALQVSDGTCVLIPD